jgi:hypothetical protein
MFKRFFFVNVKRQLSKNKKKKKKKKCSTNIRNKKLKDILSQLYFSVLANEFESNKNNMICL